MKKIGDRIAELMKANGYNQKELAQAVGVTDAAMSRYLNNDREPKIDVVGRLAVALHTTTDYLILDEESLSDFDEVYYLVSRNVKGMSEKEKYTLIKTIVG